MGNLECLFNEELVIGTDVMDTNTVSIDDVMFCDGEHLSTPYHYEYDENEEES